MPDTKFLSPLYRSPICVGTAGADRGSAKEAKAAAANGSGYNAIRYGLAAIKNVGEAATAMAIRERDERGEFVSLEDFCSRLDSRVAAGMKRGGSATVGEAAHLVRSRSAKNGRNLRLSSGVAHCCRA